MTSVRMHKSLAREIAIGVEGMHCASCVTRIEKAARRVDGVENCDVNLAMGRAIVQFDPEKTNPNQIANAISAEGYPATPQLESAAAQNEQARFDRQREEARSWQRRAIVGIALWFPIEVIHWIRHLAAMRAHAMQMPGVDWMTWLALAASTIAIAYVGWAFYRSAWRALLRRTSNMDTLIALGASVAYVYSLFALLGHLLLGWPLADLYFMEAAGLLALISLGHWLEARARESAGSAIRQLLTLAPATARLLRGMGLRGMGVPPVSFATDFDSRGRDAHATEVPVANLQVGDLILIRPGDRVPIDGVVIDGTSSVDESMISGEPLPVTRNAGDPVIGGTQNIDGALRVRVKKIGSETALAQIVHLVEHAQSSKPAVQKLADQVAAVFVPSVLLIALITGTGWFIWGSVHHWDSAHTWSMLAKSVCSVLIIACPCALGLAVPAALMVGTGLAARRGILIRDIDALQTAEKIDTIVLDKTGTITQGKPLVADIQSFDGVEPREILRLAASAEQFSEHPLARAIVARARAEKLSLVDPESFANEPGAGVTAQVEGKTILVGSESFLATRITGYQPVPHGLVARDTKTEVHIAADGSAVGIVFISDSIKNDSIDAIRELHRMNLHTVLLSGDHESAARAVAQQVGIDDVRANIKPAGKADAIRDLQNRQSTIGNRQSFVAMVGDGINDAPALAQADLGIAIGSGSDIAKETGDIVLVGSSLTGIAAAIQISRATMRTIRQNLFLAFIYNVLAIPLAALGLLNPLIAAAAMALSDVTVIGNALLLRRSRQVKNRP